tara:strand:- start:14178 stop:14708 length:531 start_codon:yes stop_codon:yes gene_type:complete
MNFKTIYFIFLMTLVSCKNQDARRPITVSKTYTLASTVNFFREINKVEERKIENYIKKDSLFDYNKSPNGFWYQYITKIDSDSNTPKKGDLVEISYEILDLNNRILYSKETIGIREYIIDKEDFILALQIGVKLMKEGETIKFIIPSFNAFGVLGDENKIGMNTSIIITLTLININ